MEADKTRSRGLRGILFKPASVTDGGEGALKNLDVHWPMKKPNSNKDS